MSSPITAEDFNNQSPSQDLCDAFRNKLLNNDKLAQLLGYMFDSSGNIAVGETNAQTLGRDIVSQILQTVCPIGSLTVAPGALGLVAPEWVVCDGTTVLDKDGADGYPVLWAVVSSWGLTTTSTTFTLPDLRGRFLLTSGSGYSAGEVDGEAEHTLTAAEMPEHTHDMTFKRSGPDSGPDELFSTGNDPGDYPDLVKTSAAAGSGDPHNNMPPYFGCAVYMRAGHRIGDTVIR
jgi:hypothetical protein